jgi:hypothetical protein
MAAGDMKHSIEKPAVFNEGLVFFRCILNSVTWNKVTRGGTGAYLLKRFFVQMAT